MITALLIPSDLLGINFSLLPILLPICYRFLKSRFFTSKLQYGFQRGRYEECHSGHDVDCFGGVATTTWMCSPTSRTQLLPIDKCYRLWTAGNGYRYLNVPEAF